jgi:hypothetical protein
MTERSPELAQEWRHRERQPAAIEGPAFDQPAPRDIRAFQAVVDGGRVHYHVRGERGMAAFTDRGKVIDIRDSHRRETVLAALQLSAQKWGTFTVHGDESFRRVCVELAVQHGFKIANPELQHAIAAERDRRRVEIHHEPGWAGTVRSPADAYRIHFADIARERGAGQTDPSRIDAEVAVRLRLTGHQPDVIARAIRDGAPGLRPDERRDWDRYAGRAIEFALSLPGTRLAEHLAPRRDIFLRLEGRGLAKELEIRRRGPQLGR